MLPPSVRLPSSDGVPPSVGSPSIDEIEMLQGILATPNTPRSPPTKRSALERSALDEFPTEICITGQSMFGIKK